MAEFIKNIVGQSGDHKVDELDEVIEYLKSLALDEDTTVEDFRESVLGFFEDVEITDQQAEETLRQVRTLPPCIIIPTEPLSQSLGAEELDENEHINIECSTENQEIPDGGISLESENPHHHFNEGISFSPPGISISQSVPSMSSWACPTCTFQNDIILPACEICGANAPPLLSKPKVKLTKEQIEELEKDLSTNSLNSILVGDAQRRRGAGRDNEEESRKLLELLVDAKVSDGEFCRKRLERRAIAHHNVKDYSLVELIGFGLTASDAKLLFEHVAAMNERPVLELHDDEEVSDASPSEINELMFLIPDRMINRTQVEYVYFVLSRKSVEIASRYLVENFVEVSEPRLSANVRKVIDDADKWWAKKKTQHVMDEEEVSKVVKETLMKRYDETPDDSKVTHRPSASYGQVTKKKDSTIRYLDGLKVNMKSSKDKFVIEDSTVEWDGGSRGKVKTKGKRGPGFV